MDLVEFTKQIYKKINDDKDIRVSMVKGRKITIIIISAISASRKLSIVSTKLILSERR